MGDSISVSFEASEALMQPVVTIGGFAADVSGKIGDWTAVREMTLLDMDGDVTVTISYTDISGVEGVAGTATTDGSAVQYCTEGCVEPEEITLTGSWKLAGEGAAGVGPTAGSKEWFATNAANNAGIAERPCLFDDAFVFGADGSFANEMGDTTWTEAWQGGADTCDTPVAPQDGSIAATYVYDEAASTLTLTGKGAHLGLAKVVNGSELASPSAAPESITYTVLTFDGEFLSVVLEAGDGVFWSYDLVKDVPSPLAGTWRLNGEGAAGVGPTAGSKEWFATNAANNAGIAERPCLFDDAFVFGADGSFANEMGDTTWTEAWQGGADTCDTPVAPQDGSIAATFVYDEAASTLTLNGQGAHLGLAKVVNGSELASPSAAPESITYTVLTFDGEFMSVVVEAGDGVFWSYDLVKDQPSPLAGTWRLDGEGAAGVGPTAGSKEWFATNAANNAGIAERPCLFDDGFVFGADGSFANEMGDTTWTEAWQGGADTCDTPVAPQDGSIAATFVYDEAASTLTLNGQGAHLGLAKVVNGSELASPSAAPASITYTVLTFDGAYMSVVVEAGDGVFWSYDLVKDVAAAPSILEGTWKLDGESAAGVGPTAGSKEWFATNAANNAGIAERPCLFDDGFVFGADGSFTNEMGDATWIEAWQGGADTCDTPVAPQDGSIAATYAYDEAAGTLTLTGQGAHLGLAKVVNGAELASPSAAPESITYTVLTIDSSYLSVVVEAGDGVFWSYDLVKQ